MDISVKCNTAVIDFIGSFDIINKTKKAIIIFGR